MINKEIVKVKVANGIPVISEGKVAKVLFFYIGKRFYCKSACDEFSRL